MKAQAIHTCSYCGVQTEGLSYCCNGCEALDVGFTSKASPPPSNLAYLDQPNFKSIYQHPTTAFDYQLYIEGIHCSSCVHLLEKISDYLPEIEFARVDYGQSRMFIKAKENLSLAQVVECLTRMGYRAHFIKSSDQLLSIQAQENKIFLKKLAVAGACAGNIMLFVIPVYSGLTGNWEILFNWMSFLLFLPVVFYSGTIFYKGAWNSLRLRNINIDLPITVALWSGFALSTFNLLRGNGQIYYDSTASFIFLILTSRYFLKRTQQKFLSATQLEDIVRDDHFLRLDQGSESIVSINEIRTDDLIKLESGQICPVDGILKSPHALIDVSVLNGEPLPRQFEQNMQILAGSKVLSPHTIIQTKEKPSDTHLAKTLHELQAGLWKKSKFTTLTDQCAQILIVVVFLIALGFFAYFFNQDPQEAFNRSLALLVLACPCALALGAPLAIALSVKKAQAKGILIKNSDVLEKILKLENIFFDKTGTLTEMELRLTSSSPTVLTDELKGIILGLEKTSYHPIAFAIRKAWPNLSAASIKDLEETISKGVSGHIQNSFYEFGETQKNTDAQFLTLNLKKDGQTICSLSFENSIRAEASQCLKELNKKSKNCFVLSGDSQPRVEHTANFFKPHLKKIFSNLTANQKQEIVQRSKNTCMIGDGTNDALALKAADVGIALKGSTSINMEAADICFTKEGLKPLLDLLIIAKQTKKVILRNLTFSLFYNTIGGTLALYGLVTPWLAAILMPISSFFILISTLWGFR